jgi:hypothetical protein
MMRKAIVAVLAVAAVMIPAALATAPAQNPTDYCKAHPELIGTGTGKLYKNMGKCVKQQTAQADANVVNAAKTCIAQKDDTNFAAGHDGKTFEQFYGTNGDNGNGKAGAKGKGNAFGKCVSTIASGKTAGQQNAQLNAAKRCRTAENKAKIGTGPDKTWRTFGACVKAQTKTTS